MCQMCHVKEETLYWTQKLDRQLSNSFLIKGGFCHGQEQAGIWCIVEGQGWPWVAVCEKKRIHPMEIPFGNQFVNSSLSPLERGA
jgi:hypothetical protein